MSKYIEKISLNLIKLFPVLILIALTLFGCQYCSPEGDEMRPLNEIRNEIIELEKSKKNKEAELKNEKKLNKQKRDSLNFINKEIDTLKILIN